MKYLVSFINIVSTVVCPSVHGRIINRREHRFYGNMKIDLELIEKISGLTLQIVQTYSGVSLHLDDVNGSR